MRRTSVLWVRHSDRCADAQWPVPLSNDAFDFNLRCLRDSTGCVRCKPTSYQVASETVRFTVGFTPPLVASLLLNRSEATIVVAGAEETLVLEAYPSVAVVMVREGGGKCYCQILRDSPSQQFPVQAP